MSESELREYVQLEYGRRGVEELDARIQLCEEHGTSYRGWTLDDAIGGNRAGPDETHLSAEQVYERFKSHEAYVAYAGPP